MKVDLRKSLFILPNLFTLTSVLCGYYAILLSSSESASQTDFYRAALLVVFAMFFGTIDGRVARMTNTQGHRRRRDDLEGRDGPAVEPLIVAPAADEDDDPEGVEKLTPPA